MSAITMSIVSGSSLPVLAKIVHRELDAANAIAQLDARTGLDSTQAAEDQAVIFMRQVMDGLGCSQCRHYCLTVYSKVEYCDEAVPV